MANISVLEGCLESHHKVLCALPYKDHPDNFAALIRASAPVPEYALVLKEGSSIVAVDPSQSLLSVVDDDRNDFSLKISVSNREILLYASHTSASTFRKSLNKAITSPSSLLFNQLNSLLSSTSTAPTSSKELRSLWIRRSLRDRIHEFSSPHPVSIHLTTFNVASMTPPPPSALVNLIPSSSPHLICFGLQEVDMTASTLLMAEKTSIAEPWITTFTEAVGSGYRLVMWKQLVGLLTILFVRDDVSVSDVRAYTIGTGLMGKMGNKGAVITTLKVFDSDLAIINSHLAAHTEKVLRRIQDAKDVVSKFEHLLTGNQFFYLDESQLIPPSNLFEFDYVFWIGDLNFRIELDYQSVVSLVDERNISELLKKDQFIQRARGRDSVFFSFKEPEIKFPPTYKVVPGTTKYIPYNPQKPRPPAWCDRCLYYCRSGGQIKSINYDRDDVLLSDHLPVSNLLEFSARSIIPEKRNLILNEVKKDLDRLTNSFIPSVELSITEFELEGLRYGSKVPILTFSIKNSSPVIVFWSFLKDSLPPYIHCSSLSGIIAPDQSDNLTLTLPIADTNFFHYCRRRSRKFQLKTVLVIRIRGGGDVFLPFSAIFEPSYFGCDLAYQIDTSSGDKISKPLWTLCDLIFSRGKSFMSKVLEFDFSTTDMTNFLEIQSIIDQDKRSIKVNSDLDSPGLLLFSLLHYLRSLPVSLIPFSMISDCCTVDSLNEARSVVSKLVYPYYNSVIYLLSFLNELIKHVTKPQLLLTLFAPVLMTVQVANRVEFSDCYTLEVADYDDPRVKFLGHLLLPYSFLT
ncbi:hypothetical protein P9112_002267 [Eukaryota sp. TZLM1-RC]